MPNFQSITDGVSSNTSIRNPLNQMSWVNVATNKRIPVDRNRSYIVSCWIRSYSGTGRRVYIGVALFDINGNNIGVTNTITNSTQWSYGALDGVEPGTSWARYRYRFGNNTARDFPLNAVYMSPLVILGYNPGTGGTSIHEAQDLRIETYEPITTQNAEAYLRNVNVSGGLITADYLSSFSANLGTITAGTVSSTNITASTITGGTITGTTLSGVTGTFSGTLTAGVVDISKLVGQLTSYSTPGNITITVPQDLTSMRTTLTGGGGGGGAGQNYIGYQIPGAGGGSSATVIITLEQLTPGQQFRLVIGSAGLGGSSSGSSGTNGTESRLENIAGTVVYCRAYGGGGGQGALSRDPTTSPPQGGTGGTGTGGTVVNGNTAASIPALYIPPEPPGGDDDCFYPDTLINISKTGDSIPIMYLNVGDTVFDGQQLTKVKAIITVVMGNRKAWNLNGSITTGDHLFKLADNSWGAIEPERFERGRRNKIKNGVLVGNISQPIINTIVSGTVLYNNITAEIKEEILSNKQPMITLWTESGLVQLSNGIVADANPQEK